MIELQYTTNSLIKSDIYQHFIQIDVFIETTLINKNRVGRIKVNKGIHNKKNYYYFDLKMKPKIKPKINPIIYLTNL